MAVGGRGEGRKRAETLSAVADPVGRARAIGRSVARAADEIEATRRIPEPLLSELHAARLLRMLLPRLYGGDEVDPATYFRAVAEISRHDASVGWNVFVANSAALIAAFLEPEAARQIFLPARALVAWGPPNDCRARAVDGGYRVSGRWDFASGCRQATWMGIHAQVEEQDGRLRQNRYGRPAVRTLLFPADKARLIDTWNTIGLRGTASDSYEVQELFVPESYTTTREEPEVRVVPGALYAFTMQGLYAVGVAGVAVGTARAMLEAFLDLGARKSPRGLPRLADMPSVQGEVGRAEARLGSASAYITETLADVYGRAGETGVIDIRDRARVRLASANAIQAGIEVADTVYKAAGIDAIVAGSPFERRFRDIHTLSQQIQSRSVHFEAVGQILLGQIPATFL